MKKYLIIIILLSLVALWPFFKKGFFESHDGTWWVIRFSAFHQALRSGQFPVRFVDRLNNNYGYPVFNFTYPLPFYLAEIPKVLGLSFVSSIKVVFVISTLLSTLAMFWALSQKFAIVASLAGSLVYLYIPYRFLDLYVRGSIGENLALAVAPLVLGCIFKMSKKETHFAPLLSFSLGLLILSHNILALLFLPTFLVFALILVKSKIKIILSFLSGLLIATFFWLPAIYDLQFVRISQFKYVDVKEHLVNPYQLLYSSWGYGAKPQEIGGLSTQMGLLPTAILIICLYLMIKTKERQKMIYTAVFSVLISLVLMTKYSLLFWEYLPISQFVQFPWRLLALVIFMIAIICAYIVDKTRKKNIAAALIIFASFTSTILYTKPASFTNMPDSFYSTNESTTAVWDEYMPLWVKDAPKDRARGKIEVSDASVEQQVIKAAKYQAVIDARKDTNVVVNTIYFPGWQAKVDGKSQPINYQNNFGLITFKLPKGIHQVIIEYKNSGIHLFSEIISIISVIAVSAYFIVQWRKQNS